LEFAFEGKPKGFQAPSYKIFTNKNLNGTVVFDVETRIVQRYITPGCTYNNLEIERTDFLSHDCEETPETELYAEPIVGTSNVPECTPPRRYSKFFNAGHNITPSSDGNINFSQVKFPSTSSLLKFTSLILKGFV
jgi:hypothetical protein